MSSYMEINNLIDDAKLALENGAFFSALTLSFALVSECANIAYPDEWFSKYADNNEYMKKQFSYHFRNGKYANNGNHDKERFIMWIDRWKIPTEFGEGETILKKYRESRAFPSPELNGELIYQLRCNLIHEGSSDIAFSDDKKISHKGNSKIASDKFALAIENEKKQSGRLVFCGHACENSDSGIVISVNGLIFFLLGYVELFYKTIGVEEFKKIPVYDYRNDE